MADIPLDTRPTAARRRGKRIVTLRDFPAEWLPQPVQAAAQALEGLPSAGVGSQGGAELPSTHPVEKAPSVPAP